MSTILSNPNFLSNPIYYSDVAIASNRTKAATTEMNEKGEILSSLKGTHSYQDTLDPGAFIETELKLKAYPKLQINGEFLQNRLTVMRQQVDQTLEISRAVKTAIMQAISPDESKASYEIFIETIKGHLGTLTNICNRSDGNGNIYLSGRAETNNAVIDLTTLTAFYEKPTSLQTKDYYRGESANMELKFEDITLDKFPITAEDPFFAKIIQACRMALGHLPSDPNKTMLQEAEKLLDEANTADFPVAAFKVSHQIDKAKALLDLLPNRTIEQQNLQAKINNQDQMLALLRHRELEQSKLILSHLQLQKAQMARQFAESFAK